MRISMRNCGLWLAGWVLAMPASAQMYRCGNVFQDRPCDAGVQEQRLSPGGTRTPSGTANAPSAATQASPFTAQCARVGEHAQRIMWKREGGATQEKQISEARGDQSMIDLILAVYIRRGSAPQVRAEIEAECVADREKQARAADMLKELQKQAGPSPASTRTPVPATADAAAKPATPPAAAKPQTDSQCAYFKSRRSEIETRLREGGSAVQMEQLQNQRREVERGISEGRC